jgi:hypothetical protein
MADLLLFAEDDAQEKFIGALIERLAAEFGLTFRLRVRSSRGGFPKVLREFESYSLACERRAEASPDVVVVAVDANCKGLKDRSEEAEARVGDILRDRLVVAIADRISNVASCLTERLSGRYSDTDAKLLTRNARRTAIRAF